MIWNRALIDAVAHEVRVDDTFDYCYVRYAAGFALCLTALKKRLGTTRVLLEVNSLGSQRFPMLESIDRRCLRVADLLISVSQVGAEQIRDVLGDERRKVMVMPNGVDISRFVPQRANSAVHNGPIRIGYVGVLKPQYGLEDLIAAFRQVRATTSFCELIVVGDGPLRKQMEAAAQDVAGVRYVGSLPFNSVPAVLQGLDILVFTASGRHAQLSPIKLYEYFAAGKAIVAADIPQVSDLAASGAAMLTYRCGDASDLASKLSIFVSSAAMRCEFGVKARKEASRHSWDQRMQLLRASLQDLARS